MENDAANLQQRTFRIFEEERGAESGGRKSLPSNKRLDERRVIRGSASAGGGVSHFLHCALSARAARGAGGMERRESDRLDRNAAAVCGARRTGTGVSCFQ